MCIYKDKYKKNKHTKAMEKLTIAGREFGSRLFMGTGKFNNNALMADAIKASETEMVTVAMKRIELEDKQDDLLSHIVQNPNIQLLPNTSGVRNAEWLARLSAPTGSSWRFTQTLAISCQTPSRL